MKKNKVVDTILDIAKDIAREKKGSLFVIGPEKELKGTYELHYANVVKGRNLKEKGMNTVLKKLATIDGATLITDNGKIIAFGARIKKSKTVVGFGTRHAAAAGITHHLPKATAILVSEEVGWIKVLQKGKVILELDASKNPRNLHNKIVSFITDNDTALLTTAGASAALLGLAPVIVVAGTYLAVKTAAGIIKKSIK